jgi:hypothetical protein
MAWPRKPARRRGLATAPAITDRDTAGDDAAKHDGIAIRAVAIARSAGEPGSTG